MYLGNVPAQSYTSYSKQDFTTSVTTSYTLDYPVANANEIALFINFVRQEPTTAYTASGTSLTLTAATSASDDMYCIFLGKALQTINPPAGSVGLSQLSATGTASASTFLRGDNSWQSAGGTMTPAFEAYLSSNQSVTSNVLTKAQINTEVFDTNSNYDNATNYRFTPTTAGKYFVHGNIQGRVAADDNHKGTTAAIYKNGTIYKKIIGNGFFDQISNLSSAYISAIIDMNGSTDYVELYGATEGTSTPEFNADTKPTFFGAYKIIE